MNAILEAGVDEAGRGPIAGPVIAGAVILPADYDLGGLTDSKRLSAARREVLAAEIRDCAIAWAIASVDAAEIDVVNILQASLRAMARAVAALSPAAGAVAVDGNRCPDIPVPARAVVGGDGSVPAISAASILAKVERDRQMVALAERYPAYGFECHKGYPTAAHIEALRAHGVSPVHRRSFAPVREALAASAPVQTRLFSR